MLISYDPEIDALHIELGTAMPVDSQDIAEGMTIDLDEQGQIVSIEVLDATMRLGKDALAELVVEGLTTTVRLVEPVTLDTEVERNSQNAE